MSRLASILVLGFTFLIAATQAQTESATPTEGAAWELHVHLQKLFASPIGKLANEVIRKEAPDGQLNIDAFVEAMGFDPRTVVGEVVLYGDDFSKTSVTAIADIGKSRGNIEGWLLAAPGYKSEPLDNNTIMHSFIVEETNKPRMWCAMPLRKDSNNYVLVAGFDRETTLALTKRLAEQGFSQVSERLTGNTFLSFSVNDLSQAPIEIDDDEPGSAIIKTIKSLTIAAANEGENLTANCEITTESPARAEQLNQLIVGMKAMVQLALPEKHPEAKQIAEMLMNLNVEYAAGTSHISARFSIGYDAIESLVKDKHKMK